MLINPDFPAAALGQNGIVPFAVSLCDSNPPANYTKATGCLQCEASGVVGNCRTLKRPNAISLGRLNECLQQRTTNTASAGSRGDVYPNLGDA
jgi:hypothetical protein